MPVDFCSSSWPQHTDDKQLGCPFNFKCQRTTRKSGKVSLLVLHMSGRSPIESPSSPMGSASNNLKRSHGDRLLWHIKSKSAKYCQLPTQKEEIGLCQVPIAKLASWSQVQTSFDRSQTGTGIGSWTVCFFHRRLIRVGAISSII